MKVIRSAVALLVFAICQGQAVPKVSDHASSEDNQIYSLSGLEVQPEFPGGTNAFLSFIKGTFKYSADLDPKVRIFVSFVVEKDGSLNDIKILRGLSPQSSEDLIRVLKKSPQWKPGMQKGRIVRTMYTLPIAFKENSAPTPK